MTVRLARKVNHAWKRYQVDHVVTSVFAPLVKRSDHFFLMGSCFAQEIRLAMDQVLGADHVVPNYLDVAYDPAHVQIDGLPTYNHLNTYNAYSVLQEVERILGLWAPAPDDFWEVAGKLQCPYRRMLFADSLETFVSACSEMDRVLREGFAVADHFIFTFGMTEIFVNRASGKVANQKPGYGNGGGKEETDYHRASFAENLTVVQRLVDLITAQKPNARIFLTVSPVPLKRTHSGEDIFVANSLSKATLRAVLGEVVATRPNVTYFPSYEAVMAEGHSAWEADGRHVQPALVEAITRNFVDTYFFAGP